MHNRYYFITADVVCAYNLGLIIIGNYSIIGRVTVSAKAIIEI